jgi:hypothetical protein
MQKYFPILVALLIVSMVGTAAVIQKKQATAQPAMGVENNIGSFVGNKSCGRPPLFLADLNIQQPVVIDLTQKRFKGIAFLHGNSFSQSLHPKKWEQYGHFSTYALDERGNIFLAPSPFISIQENTFELQKSIYKLDTKTGSLSIFMTFKDVHPSPNNPYGINAVIYDCEDKTLWVSAIDETDYETQRGVIYHVDPKTKTVLQKINSIDALTLALVTTDKGKFLLAGAARDNGLYAYPIIVNRLQEKPVKILSLPRANEHIRKIKVAAKNHLALQAIPFSYALIAQTAEQDRIHYKAKWKDYVGLWDIERKKPQ